MDKFRDKVAESLPAAIFAAIFSLGGGVLALYGDNSRNVADIKRINTKVDIIEARLDQCSERVSRLSAFIEFTK